MSSSPNTRGYLPSIRSLRSGRVTPLPPSNSQKNFEIEVSAKDLFMDEYLLLNLLPRIDLALAENIQSNLGQQYIVEAHNFSLQAFDALRRIYQEKFTEAHELLQSKEREFKQFKEKLSLEFKLRYLFNFNNLFNTYINLLRKSKLLVIKVKKTMDEILKAKTSTEPNSWLKLVIIRRNSAFSQLKKYILAIKDLEDKLFDFAYGSNGYNSEKKNIFEHISNGKEEIKEIVKYFIDFLVKMLEEHEEQQQQEDMAAGSAKKTKKKSLDKCTVEELKERAKKRGVSFKGCKTKDDMIAKLRKN